MSLEGNSNQYRGRCGKCDKPVTKSYKFCFRCNKERNLSSEKKRQRSNEFGINNAGSQPNGCSKCPKSAGPERCQYCSPENFCCVPEHGNSSSFMTDKVMCPKCSPNNFCRDPKHGNSEDNPAHKSSCRKCSHDYFNNVSNEQVSGREGGNVGYQRVGYQLSSTHFRSSGGERLSATKLAEHFSSTGNKVSAQKMNKIIEEIGWTRGYSGGGYEPTKQGLRKDVLRLESQRGTPYCSYPPGIIHDLALISRFADISPASARFSNVSPIQTQSSQGNSGDCVCYCGKCSLLGKSQKYKTRDGHFVRSRGEVMIDNYLYTSRVAHAYELDLILTDSERMSSGLHCSDSKWQRLY